MHKTPFIIVAVLISIFAFTGCRGPFDDGYALGRADSAKAAYNYIQKVNEAEYANKGDEPEFRTYSFPGPSEVNGVKFAPHTMNVRTVDVR